MDVVVVLVVLVAAVLLIAAPLRLGRSSPDEAASGGQADLEAAKEAKYREIRDAELDYRTGKLAKEDWQRLDASLRAEALDLLHRLDALDGERDRPL